MFGLSVRKLVKVRDSNWKHTASPALTHLSLQSEGLWLIVNSLSSETETTSRWPLISSCGFSELSRESATPVAQPECKILPDYLPSCFLQLFLFHLNRRKCILMIHCIVFHINNPFLTHILSIETIFN